MPYTIIEDFGTPLQVAKKMTDSGTLATKARPILEFVSADMIRVTGILWDTNAARFGGWKRLAPSTVAHKGNKRILWTEGSNPSYTPHPDDNVLHDSVTEVGAPHQILNVTDRTIEFGTNIKYAKRQYAVRPFILFSKYDKERWAKWIVNYITKPFDRGTLVTTPRIRQPRSVAPASFSTQTLSEAAESLGVSGTGFRTPKGGRFTSVQAIGGGFMLRGGNPANIGQFSGAYGQPLRGGYGHSGNLR